MSQLYLGMSLQRKQISIQPQYLLQIASSIETLNHFYEQQGIGSLCNDYRNLLGSSFGSLNQDLQTYSNSVDASAMVATSILKCKTQIEVFCLERLGVLLSRETEELGAIVLHIASLWRDNVDDFERMILLERRKRAENTENQRDRIIAKLKDELVFRKDYIEQLKQRLADVQNENSKIYQKIISNAKSTTQRALSPSPRKNTIPNMAPSPSKLLNAMSSHKTLSAKQVEETIIEIMETKLKQQQLKSKRVSLRNYLKTFFKFKFGIKDLAEETEQSFKEAVQFFAHAHEKNSFVLFQRMLAQECDEAFFWEQKTFCERLVKIIKRYLNEKDNVSLDDLEQLYNSKLMDQRSDIRLTSSDIKLILMNTYKTPEVQSLHMILREILLPKLKTAATMSPETSNLRSFMQQEQSLIPSKMLINEILNYELSRHLLKIEDILRIIRDIDNDRGYLNSEELESILARLKIPEDKISAFSDLLNSFHGKFVTYSEAIECIERIRKSKTNAIKRGK